METRQINAYVNCNVFDDGTLSFSRIDPTIGLTEDQIKSYNSIKSSASQDQYLRANIKRPEGYLDFKADDPENQDAMDVISLYNKVNGDPAYLNSLSYDDFNNLMNDYIDIVGPRLTAIKAGCYTMTDDEFATASDVDKMDAINKSSEVLSEWQENLIEHEDMLACFSPETMQELQAIESENDAYGDYVHQLFNPILVNDDGTYRLADPTAGLTEAQLEEMRMYETAAEQDEYLRKTLDYPADYLEAKAEDPAMQEVFDRISLYEKLNNASYLCTLDKDELQSLVEKGIETYEQYGSDFDSETVDAWIQSVTADKTTEELIKYDLIGYLRSDLIDISPEEKEQLMDEYEETCNIPEEETPIPEEEIPMADQPSSESPETDQGEDVQSDPTTNVTFEDMKERAKSVFAVIKNALESWPVTAWIIDKGTEFYNKFFKPEAANKESQQPEQSDSTPNYNRDGSEFGEGLVDNSSGTGDYDVDI